jgi:hypothetical protein
MKQVRKLKINLSHTIDGRKLPPGKIALRTAIAAGITLLLVALIFVFVPQIYLDGLLKDRIIGAFAKAYPEYSLKIAGINFNILKNRLECDSISLTKIDATFSCRTGAFSIDGIDWIKLYREKKISLNVIASAVLDAEDIAINSEQSQIQIQCGRLHLSIPDSAIVADALEFHPSINDEQFFAGSRFRNTRYRFVIPEISVNGLVYSGLLHGNNYRARSINIRDAFIDILVNMDKPWNTNAINPLMPNESLSSMKDTIRVDSLLIVNGRLNYNERYVVGAEAALVTFDKMQALALGIVNHTGRLDTIAIHAQGMFMNAATMKLHMSIPLGSPQFSFSYGGSVGEMQVSRLNGFLETAERHRIKSGVLHGADFEVDVNSGRATGYVRAEYSGLSIAILDKYTGSERGIADRISSLIGKLFVIRGTNTPDKKGSMKIGVVKFTRKPDEPFIQFAWFALRSGVGNTVGF